MTQKLALKTTDANGSIVKRWVDWNADGAWDDSSTVTDTFIYFWDTTFGDKIIVVNTSVMDNDSIVTSKTCSILVDGQACSSGKFRRFYSVETGGN